MNYREKFSLSGKTCYVLGGSGLIGAEICKSFLDFDAQVVCLDKGPPINPLGESMMKIKSFIYEDYDCSDLENLEENFQKIVSLHDCPDVFVNVSYPRTKEWGHSSFKDLELNSLKENIEINLVSAIWISRLVAELMKEKKVEGNIINFGSIYGIVGQNLNIYEGTSMQENSIYSSIKGALVNQTRQMASIYGKHNIRINCISPGGVEGPYAENNGNQEDKFVNNYSVHAPLNRLAKAEEIAPAAVFLASQASSYVTGMNLIIDGGWTII
tara:strand:- start:411 stop:1220 length:810 start_codon:yes stop_codon:yes gene_type:complete